MEYRVRLRGRGSIELAANGVADAEHQVEKELRRLWSDASIGILGLRRSGAGETIVEAWVVDYRLEGCLAVEASSPEEATRVAFQRGRDRLAGSRYWAVAWEKAEVEGVGKERFTPS